MWENVRIEGTGPPIEGQGAGSLAARLTPLDYPSTPPQPPIFIAQESGDGEIEFLPPIPQGEGRG